ncbi:MAG: PRC-barrel domain-containing protein [Solirubrobacterales bacterium]
MRRPGWWIVVILAVALAAAVAALAIPGDPDHAPPTGRTSASTSVPHTSGSRPSQPSGQPEGVRPQVRRAVHESRAARLDSRQVEVAAVVRSYVAALDRRAGGRLCRLFVPGTLSRVRLPRRRGGCASSLVASIGYRDPRGYPVYDGSRVARIASVSIDGDRARVVATTVTRFADQREPSIEDDVVYLRRIGGRWLIAKPSAALYRAIGVGDIPPRALSPP